MTSCPKPTYFNPMSNIGFHKIFCTEGNEELVLQLLNAVIDDRQIESFERLDSYHQINEKTHSVFDLYCKCADGSRIIVECQNKGGSAMFMNRALAYSSLAVLDQAVSRWEYAFSKVYFIGLLNYVHFKDRQQAITKIALCTLDDHIVTNENYLQVFVEMPKLAAEAGNGDFRELFLSALRDIGKTPTRPERFADARLDSLFKASDYANLSSEEQKKYDKDMSTEEEVREYIEERVKWGIEDGRKMGVEEGRKIGIEEGRKEGLKQGRKESAIEIARALLNNGVPQKLIFESTGLSLEDLESLR